MASDSNDLEPLVFTNYESTLHKSFVDMFLNEKLTDGTIICDNKTIRIHKFLLSASSSFFNNIFKKYVGDCKVSIKNVDYDDLLKVLEYIYNGQTKLHPNKVNSFIDATKKLSVTINDDEIRRISANINGIKLNGSEQNIHGGNAVAEIETDCNENTTSIGIGETETIRINKNNSKNERDRTQKKTNKKEKTGIIEVSQMEFIERMFKARNLQFPMNNDQTVQNVAQQSNVKPQTLKQISKTSSSQSSISSQPSTSKSKPKPKSVKKPESISENESIDSNIPNSVRQLKHEIRNVKRSIGRDIRLNRIDDEDMKGKVKKLEELEKQLGNVTAMQGEKKPIPKAKIPEWKKTRKQKQLEKTKKRII